MCTGVLLKKNNHAFILSCKNLIHLMNTHSKFALLSSYLFVHYYFRMLDIRFYKDIVQRVNYRIKGLIIKKNQELYSSNEFLKGI